MSRETKTVNLPISGCQVEVVEKLNFGEYTDIQEILDIKATGGDANIGGKTLMIGLKKVVELIVKKITKDTKEMAYSEQWLRELDLEDGLVLVEYAKELLSKKK